MRLIWCLLSRQAMQLPTKLHPHDPMKVEALMGVLTRQLPTSTKAATGKLVHSMLAVTPISKLNVANIDQGCIISMQWWRCMGDEVMG